MIGYSHCGIGSDQPGCVVPYTEPEQETGMLQYVMIDPGTPLPHVQASPQLVGFYGDDDDDQPRQMTSRELFDQLYEQNKLAFWVGGGIFGALALSGLFGLLRR
jgi:hypothetical protein